MSDWLVPHFVFNGKCEEAMKFYQTVLGGDVKIMHFGDAPSNPAFQVPEHVKNLVLHGELRKDGHVLRFSDTFQNAQFTLGNTISFSLEFDTEAETKKMFEALAEGGKTEMEPQKTFFSPLYCKFTDKFGIMWQILCKAV